MKRNIYAMVLFNAIMLASCLQKNEMAWYDDFDSLDNNKWNITTGNGCPTLCGFGNNELQTYTSDPRNLRVEDGLLILEGHYDTLSGTFTSAKVTTESKGDWKYGTIEVKAKIPGGTGVWPAIWMLPSQPERVWPDDGEIDIMEHVGYNPNWVFGTVHSKNRNGLNGLQASDSIFVDNSYSDFSVYAINWSEDKIEWSVDNKVYHTITREEYGADWPFNKPFHLIMNLAVGGNWGGKHGVDREIWPVRMEIDYVKVTGRKTLASLLGN